MHARVVSNQIQPGKMDEWLAIVRDSVVPSLNEQDGFQGFVALIDREHDKSIGYSMWTSAAELAADETSGNYQQQIAKLGDVLAGPPVREVHQVTVVAWQ
jgi:quinol monooxygenase YgiN